MSAAQRIAVVGGGLAGMAAALRLAEQGMRVELFEARQALGGRAASYRDPATGELVDHCQHVAMACCTNFHDFCQRAGIGGEFDRYDMLHFVGPVVGTNYKLRASWWLPAPLHLAPAFLRQGYLTWRERLRIGTALLALARTKITRDENVGDWLRRHGQSEQAINRFWSVVLVSALGETIDKASLIPARKVFVDGFMANRQGYQIDVPRRPLRELFDGRVAEQLAQRGVIIHRSAPIDTLLFDGQRVAGIQRNGQSLTFDGVILAMPWRRLASFLPEDLRSQLPSTKHIEKIAASPISGVHLWFDRPLTTLPHAVLVDRLSQWVFRRESANDHYYQVVISASRDLRGMSSASVVEQVVADLAAVFPAARDAKLLASKVVTEHEAVFSYSVGFDEHRPAQATAINNLFLAGDWTQTGWPSTLESAVRSGYLAAERVLERAGRPQPLLAPDLPRGWLARWFL